MVDFNLQKELGEAGIKVQVERVEGLDVEEEWRYEFESEVVVIGIAE